MRATNESPHKGISKSSDESSGEAADGSGEKTLK
jgi:hypothetical protein